MVARGSGAGPPDRRRLAAGRASRGWVRSRSPRSVLLSGCSVDDAFSFGWPKGGITDQSQRMYDLWIGSVIAALVVGVFVWGLIFWCIIRYRKRGDELPPQTRYNLPIEILYSVAAVPHHLGAVLLHRRRADRRGQDPAEPGRDRRTWSPPSGTGSSSTRTQKDASGQPVSTIGADDYIPVLVVPTDKRIRFLEDSAGRHPLVLGTGAAVQAGRVPRRGDRTSSR